MKRVVVALSLALVACNPVAVQRLADGDKEIRQRFRIDGLTIHNGEHFNTLAADECPGGFEKVGERVERQGADDYLIWRVRCRT